MSTGAAAVCSAPGCQKSTWDGKPGYCTIKCKGLHQAALADDDAADEPCDLQGDEQSYEPDYSYSQAPAAGGYPPCGGAFLAWGDALQGQLHNGFLHQTAWCPSTAAAMPWAPQMASPEICQLDGCTEPTYDGKPGFCTKEHKDRVVPLCQFPNCKRSAFRGKPGFCGTTHLNQARAMGLPCAAAGPQALARAASLQALPAAAAASPQPSLAPLAARTAPGCELVQPGDAGRQNVWQQFCGKWPAHAGTCPAEAVVTFYKITMPQHVEEAFKARVTGIGDQVPRHGRGQNPGNRQRRFHGTNFKCSFQGKLCDGAANGDCPGCSILNIGFKQDFIGRNSGNTGRFGQGHYSTATGGTAYGYSKMKGTKPAVLVCCVAVGKADMIQAPSGSQNLAAIQPGCHSKVIDKDSGVDELLVPYDDQMLPLWVMVFP